ncbi:MAG TPA: right-handed parallel beta-helix repeat-containing protein [Gemmataceae bacterium]|nr:right-handed parallel beta-helix repeat-containing protein [Gemmataceae bacterium]
MRTRWAARLLLVACCLYLLPASAFAASRTLQAGQILGISEDLVLSGDDALEVNGTAEKPCRIDANGQQLRTSADWKGRIRVRYCEFRSLGTATKPALDVTGAGDGQQIVIEHSEFHACGAVHLANQGTSATVFRRNTLHANSMVPVTNLPSSSPPGFRATGQSSARHLFQGNRVYRSVVLFENTRNWLIGGERDEDANILIGMRASLSLHSCSDTRIRGNYIHTEIPSYRWSQVHALAVGRTCSGVVIEHNVIRHGQWVVRGVTGEFRYNLVLDADAHNFIVGPSGRAHIHHNIFARYCTVDPNLNSSIAVIYKADDIQIYNNTFDGGGKDMARPWHVPAIEVGSEAFLTSLRNNVFYNHPTKFASGTAIVRPGFAEKKTEPGPARLGYADYNLFYNPDAAARDNYALSVKGKTERADAGFARNDVPAGGAKDAQVEPKFRGPIPKRFPFRDEHIKIGKVTVAQILAHYREVYAPGAGSPLLGAGDPADGAGSYIGAVGPGGDAAADYFGRPQAAPIRR